MLTSVRSSNWGHGRAGSLSDSPRRHFVSHPGNPRCPRKILPRSGILPFELRLCSICSSGFSAIPVRRWTGSMRAVHFYVFCLASFILYSFHYTGKALNLLRLDRPTLGKHNGVAFCSPRWLVHFSLVFPERRGKLWPKLRWRSYTPCPRAPLCCCTRLSRIGCWILCRPLATVTFWRRWKWSTWRATRWVRPEFSWRKGYFRAPMQHPETATQVGNRGATLAGFLPFYSVLYFPALLIYARVSALDEAFGIFAGLDSSLLRLRHRSLPADGR